MNTKKNTQWFLEPKDDHTNQVIATMLEVADTAMEQKRMLGSDSREHAVWQVEYALIERLRRSKAKGSPLDYKVWKRDATYGSIQPAPDFHQMRRRQKRRRARKTTNHPA